VLQHSGRCILLVVLIAGAAYGFYQTPSILKKDFSDLIQEESSKTKDALIRSERKINARILEYETELAAIKPIRLNQAATARYNRELAGRKSYDKRFALSPRERAQLQMQSLASDSTKSLHDAIRAVAKEASPGNSSISVRESSSGIELHIEFDMSSMTSGEHGVQTKHQTTDSLKKEVSSLILKATNDIFLFCKDLNLSSIHVGCRHLVIMEQIDGTTRNELSVLYKVRIQRNRVQELTSNPFLDTYSITRYIEAEEDNFKGISIINSRL
jgi:hypothetical protein